MSKAVITPSAKGKEKAKDAAGPSVEDDIAAPMAKPPVSDAPASSSTSTALVTVTGDLHLFDRATGLFMCQEEGVEAALHPTESEYWLLVTGKGGTWVSQGVNKDMVVNFSEAEKAMVFNFSLDEGGEVYTWLIRFKEENSFNQIQEGISTALFEDKWGKGAWNKLKSDERDYQKTAYIEDAEMYGIEEEGQDEQEEEEQDQGQEDDEEEEDSGEEQSDEDERESFHGAGKKSKNSLLAVGYKEDLSFVVQGDMIGVFKQQREGGKKLKFVTSIVNLSAPNGAKAAFTPSKVMLHNQGQLSSTPLQSVCAGADPSPIRRHVDDPAEPTCAWRTVQARPRDREGSRRVQGLGGLHCQVFPARRQVRSNYPAANLHRTLAQRSIPRRPSPGGVQVGRLRVQAVRHQE